MKIRFLFLSLLSLWLSLPVVAKGIVVDEISFPLETVYVTKDGDAKLDTPGELRITVRYWDTFRYPDNNSYEMTVRALPNIFSSPFSGVSANEIRNNNWGRNSWFEKNNVKGANGIVLEQVIIISNGTWDTRFGISPQGLICVSYGKLADDGSITKINKTVFLKDRGKATWNKLVNFLHNNWKNHKIGKILK